MEDLSADPPPATGPYVITTSKPGRGWEYERNPQWAKNNAKLLPQLPSGHVDKIKIEVLRNPQTEVNDVESGKLDWMQNEVPPDRYQSVLVEVRRQPVPGRADGQHLLLLDEHDGGAVQRRQGAPGGQLRDRPARRWNGSTRAG